METQAQYLTDPCLSRQRFIRAQNGITFFSGLLAYIVFVTLFVLAGACASSQNSSSGTRDGSSYENAIVVKSIQQEYAWIATNFPGSKVVSQALTKYQGKHYDILSFTTQDGESKKAYFDISKFFGRGL